MRPEMLNLWLALGLLLFSLFLIIANRAFHRWWVVLRTRFFSRGSEKKAAGVKDDPVIRDDLLAQGVDGEEAELLMNLFSTCDEPNMSRLLNSRFAFEDALEKALSADPDLIRELGSRRALDRIRLRRGWEVAGEISQGLSLPTEDEELLIHGADGLSFRTVMIHRDAQSLAVRVLESSDPADDFCPWEAGEDLQVSFYRADCGCFLFETRLQEKRDLGDWFFFLETPHKVRIEQRRQSVRVPLDGQIRFLHLPLGDRSPQGCSTEPIQEASLIDVGTGGLGFATEAEVDPGDLLIIRGIPTLESREITARVVGELSNLDLPDGGIGVRFVGMSATDRDRMASLVFSRRVEVSEIGSQFDSTEATFPADGKSR